MNVTLINGNVISSDDIVFHLDNLNNGNSPVFTQSSSGADLDNLLKVADMDSMFSGEGWSYDQWNSWRAAHPVTGANPVPFQDQNGTIPGTSIPENLVNQNWFDTAANYYLDTFDTPAKKIGSAVAVVIIVAIVISIAKGSE